MFAKNRILPFCSSALFLSTQRFLSIRSLVKTILHITPTYLPLYLQLTNRGTPGLLSIKVRVYLMHDHLSARHVSRQDVSIPQRKARRKKNGPTSAKSSRNPLKTESTSRSGIVKGGRP